jgi:gluconokinase
MYFVGVDIGTTSTKAIVLSPSGTVKGTGNQGYSILSPQPAWAEQDPEAIFTAVISAIRAAIDQANAIKQEIAAVGFSAAMHSLIAVDAKGSRLTNSIIWADNRSIVQTERLKQDGSSHELYLRTGTPIHPMLPLTKLLWMREADPEIFHKAAKFLSIKEYVFHRLFGWYVVDTAIASATGLFNLKQLDWDQEALAVTGVHRDQLSSPVSTTHILQGMKPQYAEAMGLDPGTPIVIGASDGVLANLGVGAVTSNQVGITIGTSGAVRTVVQTPITDPQERTFCYALTQDLWVVGGATNSGGGILRWLRDEFCRPEVEQAKQQGLDPYEVMIQSAAQVPAGAEGLLCLPFLAGERAPYWNANARGVFFGIGLHHQRSHFIRAVLEGILLSVYSIYVALCDLVGDAQEIRAAGGFARSQVWRQMMADVLGHEVLIPEVYEASSFGAAVLAMYAVGAIQDLAEVRQLIYIGDRHQPSPQLISIYRELFDIYQRIYNNVTDEFTQLANYQRRADRPGI